MTEPDATVRLRRHPERGSHDRAVISAILDEALICHLGVTVDEHPLVLPTLCVRDGDRLILHASSLASSLTAAASGVPVCVTATLVDGLVLARAAFSHSVNYRSVVIHGTVEEITEPAAKLAALEALVNKVAPGRWAEVRHPSVPELALTRVVALSLDRAAAKIRQGPPVDSASDRALDVWAGVLPLLRSVGAEQPDPDLRPGIEPSPSVVLRSTRPSPTR